MTTEISEYGSIPELRLEIKVRNNRLIRLREDFRLGCREMAEKTGISYSTLVQYESCRKDPINKNGEWLPSALTIAEWHGVSPDYIWPDVILAVVNPISTSEVHGDKLEELVSSYKELETVPNYDDSIERRQLRSATDRVLSTLTPREERVLRLRFGLGDDFDTDHDGMSLEEVGEAFDVTQERVRQIEAKALRKMRHPTRAKALHSFVNPEGTYQAILQERISRRAALNESLQRRLDELVYRSGLRNPKPLPRYNTYPTAPPMRIAKKLHRTLEYIVSLVNTFPTSLHGTLTTTAVEAWLNQADKCLRRIEEAIDSFEAQSIAWKKRDSAQARRFRRRNLRIKSEINILLQLEKNKEKP